MIVDKWPVTWHETNLRKRNLQTTVFIQVTRSQGDTHHAFNEKLVNYLEQKTTGKTINAYNMSSFIKNCFIIIRQFLKNDSIL